MLCRGRSGTAHGWSRSNEWCLCIGLEKWSRRSALRDSRRLRQTSKASLDIGVRRAVAGARSELGCLRSRTRARASSCSSSEAVLNWLRTARGSSTGSQTERGIR